MNDSHIRSATAESIKHLSLFAHNKYKHYSGHTSSIEFVDLCVYRGHAIVSGLTKRLSLLFAWCHPVKNLKYTITVPLLKYMLIITFSSLHLLRTRMLSVQMLQRNTD